ncbi:hypothetical protein G5I_00792 [Acromyrmex echinatior]|uniref:Ig-like domain-containing protein n=1 Tax=Acromyrmex echinatior TaxID=103372 RepID=F4W5U3_ACREC|nr:hypothetical protein G5I_00792 [Acromyrmex echinatior]
MVALCGLKTLWGIANDLYFGNWVAARRTVYVACNKMLMRGIVNREQRKKSIEKSNGNKSVNRVVYKHHNYLAWTANFHSLKYENGYWSSRLNIKYFLAEIRLLIDSIGHFSTGISFNKCLFTVMYIENDIKNSLFSTFVSWIKRKNLLLHELLTVGLTTYANDERFQAIHFHHSEDWTLQIKYVQPRDAGLYECQVSTHPPTISSFKRTILKKIESVTLEEDSPFVIHFESSVSYAIQCYRLTNQYRQFTGKNEWFQFTMKPVKIPCKHNNW